ncbi:MAG: hemerythrin family protein [Ignavibacteriae bacterium]|nr:hemerythrin family protein [Ignavibacteriota bacterium]
MDFIKFEKEHILGIKEIDSQHKEIYKSVSYLYEIKDGDKKEILENFQSLLQKLKVHFETEENLMKKNKVVEFISHKLEHDRALEKYSTYFKNYKKANAKLDIEILNSLKSWLENHFEKKDIKLKQISN